MNARTIVDDSTACPCCGHDIPAATMIRCDMCGERFCRDCIHETETGGYVCETCRYDTDR